MTWYCVTGKSIFSEGHQWGAELIGYTLAPLCFLADIPVSLVTDTVMIYPDLQALKEAEKSLEFVVSEGSVRKARKLLEQGADPNGRKDKRPLLVTACEAENFELIRLLVEHGANVNLRRKEGNYWCDTPLITSVQFRNIPIARYLIQHGADVNIADDRGQTPLMYANETIHYVGPPTAIQLMGLLIKNGANVNAVCPGEGTVLDRAMANEKELGLQFKYGANIPRENTVLIALKNEYSSQKEIVLFLRAHGAMRAAELKLKRK